MTLRWIFLSVKKLEMSTTVCCSACCILPRGSHLPPVVLSRMLTQRLLGSLLIAAHADSGDALRLPNRRRRLALLPRFGWGSFDRPGCADGALSRGRLV